MGYHLAIFATLHGVAPEPYNYGFARRQVLQQLATILVDLLDNLPPFSGTITSTEVNLISVAISSIKWTEFFRWVDPRRQTKVIESLSFRASRLVNAPHRCSEDELGTVASGLDYLVSEL